jgi:hypothetical protein
MNKNDVKIGQYVQAINHHDIKGYVSHIIKPQLFNEKEPYLIGIRVGKKLFSFYTCDNLEIIPKVG